MTDTRDGFRRLAPVAPSRGYVAAWIVLGTVAIGYVGLVAGPLAPLTAPWQVAGAPDSTSDSVPAAIPPVAAVAEPAPAVVPPVARQGVEPVPAPVKVAVVPTILNGTTVDAPLAAPTTSAPALPLPPKPPAAAPAPNTAVPDSLAKVQEFLGAASPVADAAGTRPVMTTGSLPALQPPPAPKPLPKVTVLAPRTTVVVPPAAAADQAAVLAVAAPVLAPVRPAVVRPAPAPVGVLLGGDASLDEVRARWVVTSAKNATLATLEPRVVATDALGSQSYRLVAGPVATKADAAKVCAELKAAGVACRVGGFAGQPF